MTNDEFALAVTAMMHTLYRVCYSQLRNKSDREDAVQEALCRAWDKRTSLRDERFFNTWLIRILINECRNIQRRNSLRILNENDEPGEIPSPAGSLDGSPDGVDTELHDAILRLPEKLRLPLVLHHMEGYRVFEVSKILRIPQGTVKTRLAAGRRELKLLLDKHCAFHVLDINGNELNINIETIGVSINGWDHTVQGSPYDYLPVQFVLRSAESLPDKIMLRPRNIFTQEDYNPVTVEIKS